MIRNVPEDARLEIKFVANETNREIIRNWLKLNGSGFYHPYPDRWVNNIYFDTHHYYAYNENLSGSSSRTKVRYRWYGNTHQADNGVLEIKCKRNYFGWKIRFHTTDAPNFTTSSWQQIISWLTNQIGPEARSWIDNNPHPVMINRYLREYFVTHDNKIRATIDTHQSFFDQRYKPYPNIRNKANTPAILVLEFKFSRHDRLLASQTIQGLPLRVSRNSKYIFGVKSMFGV